MRMRTFYVATKFENFMAARALVDQLTALGFLNTHDWSRTDEFSETGGYTKTELTEEDARRYALAALVGAANADFLVLLPFPNMMGALLEVGIALSNRRQVFIIGECRYTVFWSLPNVHRLNSIDELFENLIP